MEYEKGAGLGVRLDIEKIMEYEKHFHEVNCVLASNILLRPTMKC